MNVSKATSDQTLPRVIWTSIAKCPIYNVKLQKWNCQTSCLVQNHFYNLWKKIVLAKAQEKKYGGANAKLLIMVSAIM